MESMERALGLDLVNDPAPVEKPHVTVRVALGVGKAIIAMPMLTLQTSS
jgi:hypothetical protein